MFVLFVVKAARVRTDRYPRRSFAVIVQEPRFLNAIQGMPVQFRLTAPISIHTACASLRSLVAKTLRARGRRRRGKGPPVHGREETPCHFHAAG